MTITLLKAKIHRAVVTQADLNYVGSITIDSHLLREAGIMEYEKVENGAAAKCVNVGDKVIIMAYADMTPEEAKAHKPVVLFVDEQNQIFRKANYEKHGILR